MLRIERVAIDTLTPDPANVRKHDDRNLAAIKGSLIKFGQQTPIVVDAKGVVIKGNGTLTAAKMLGWDTIDVVRTDLTGTEAVGYAIADNRTSELASWDDESLTRTLQALKDADFELDMIGFDDWLETEPEPKDSSDDGGPVDPQDDGDDPGDPPPPEQVPARCNLGDVWTLGRHRLVCGDSGDTAVVDRLGAEGAAHALVSDPPYGLGFMGKRWDYSVPKAELWRVWLDQLAPGAHILMFSGTRTYHRAVVELEDAGVEVRDQMQWLYGSGFPKSHDVSKAIDKAAGAEREVIGYRKETGPDFADEQFVEQGSMMQTHTRAPRTEIAVTIPATAAAAAAWQGFGTALKPSNEPICVARKPLGEDTVAANVLVHGTGGLNIDGTRIAAADQEALAKHWDRTQSEHQGIASTRLKAIDLSDRAPSGRWPSNVILSHHELCRQVGMKTVGSGEAKLNSETGRTAIATRAHNERQPNLTDSVASYGEETVEAWECDASCPVRILDEQSGILQVGHAPKLGKGSPFGGKNDVPRESFNYDGGGASRFFYTAKSSRSDRGIGNDHATVKPLRLMEYLVCLVTAEGQTVLEPFCGSGTTLIACEKTGRTCLAAELDPHHCDIVIARWEALTGEKAVVA